MASIYNEAIMHVQEHLGVFQYRSVFSLLPFLEAAFEVEGNEEIKNCPNCQTFYGISKMYGSGIVKDVATGIKYITVAANQGYAKAQYNLAIIYETGEGVDVDIKKAYEYCKAAAEQQWEDSLQALPRIERKYRSFLEMEKVEGRLNGCDEK